MAPITHCNFLGSLVTPPHQQQVLGPDFEGSKPTNHCRTPTRGITWAKDDIVRRCCIKMNKLVMS